MIRHLASCSSIGMRLGVLSLPWLLTTAVLADVGGSTPGPLTTATPYQVLRDPTDLRVDRRTSLEQDRPMTPVVPRMRRTYAYGWFGVSPRSHHQVRSDMYGQRTTWSAK